MLLPTARLFALLALAAPLFLLGDVVALVVDGLILAAAATDALLAPRRRQLRIERKVPASVALGSTAEVELEIRNGTGRAIRCRVTDDLPAEFSREPGTSARHGPGSPDVFECDVAPGGRARLMYRIRPNSRGEAVLGDVHVRARGPLGLAWRQYRITAADPVRVLPGLAEVKRHRLLGLRHRLALAGARTVRTTTERGEFESLREYVRGDDPRTLDWKATARRGQPMVRRYQAERSQNILLAIDCGRLMSERIGGHERLDHALGAALLLADVAAAHGDRVGFLLFDDRIGRYLPPTRVSLPRLADAFGDAQARLVEPNYPAAFAYLGERLRRRSLVVLFTDVIDTRASSALIAHLGRAAARHLPLIVALRNPELDATATASVGSDADVFRRAAAEELLQARAHALTSMRRAGVLVADATPDTATHALINRYLEVKRDGLL